MKITKTIELELDIEDFDVLQYDEAIKIILAIDLKMADVGFTELLIVKLMESVKMDMSAEEYAPYQNFLDSIKN